MIPIELLFDRSRVQLLAIALIRTGAVMTPLGRGRCSFFAVASTAMTRVSAPSLVSVKNVHLATGTSQIFNPISILPILDAFTDPERPVTSDRFGILRLSF
jgi:hypothetical protein